MHNPLNGGQSYAGTFESLLRVKTLKYAKQLVQVLHIRSYSIVFDKYHRLIRVVGRRTYLGSPHETEFGCWGATEQKTGIRSPVA
jgi:hypothetical protein